MRWARSRIPGIPQCPETSPALRISGSIPLPSSRMRKRKLVLIVTNFDLDEAGSGVREGIPDHLSRDSVDFILQHRRKVLLIAFNHHTIARSMLIQFVSRCQFTASVTQQFRKVALRCRFRAQIADRGPSFRNAFFRRMNCLINDCHRVVCIPEQQPASCLKLKNRPLQRLKKSIVQFSRNAGSFVDNSSNPAANCSRTRRRRSWYTVHGESQESHCAKDVEPCCLVPGREDCESYARNLA